MKRAQENLSKCPDKNLLKPIHINYLLCVQLTFYYASNSKGFFRKIIRHSRLKAASEKKNSCIKNDNYRISQLFHILATFYARGVTNNLSTFSVYLNNEKIVVVNICFASAKNCLKS